MIENFLPALGSIMVIIIGLLLVLCLCLAIIVVMGSFGKKEKEKYDEALIEFFGNKGKEEINKTSAA
jgi:hypothetical protein